ERLRARGVARARPDGARRGRLHALAEPRDRAGRPAGAGGPRRPPTGRAGSANAAGRYLSAPRRVCECPRPMAAWGRRRVRPRPRPLLAVGGGGPPAPGPLGEPAPPDVPHARPDEEQRGPDRR